MVNEDQSSRSRILYVAEELFSKNGFDGTSVDSIASGAEVNKALIYYYFKNKNAIILALFEKVMEELAEHLKESSLHNESTEEPDFPDKIKKEIEFFRERKEIISILLMESLKDNQDYFLFECGEMIIRNELESSGKNLVDLNESKSQPLLIFEFFTAIIPILSFIAYEDKWCDYFGCSTDEAVDLFVNSLNESHFKFNGFEAFL